MVAIAASTISPRAAAGGSLETAGRRRERSRGDGVAPAPWSTSIGSLLVVSTGRSHQDRANEVFDILAWTDDSGTAPIRKDEVAITQRATFKEIPGIAPDIMRDYDLATLGYEETEFSIEGMATSYELQGERGMDGRWDVAPGAEARFPDTIRGATSHSNQTGSAARSWWSGTTCRPASTPLPTGGSSTVIWPLRVTLGSACRPRRSASTVADSSRASI